MAIVRYRRTRYVLSLALIVLGALAVAWILSGAMAAGGLLHWLSPKDPAIAAVGFVAIAYSAPAFAVVSAWTWCAARGSAWRLWLMRVVAAVLLGTAVLGDVWYVQALTPLGIGTLLSLASAALPAGLWLLTAFKKSQPTRDG